MNEEYLLVRWREELKRNGLSIAELARRLAEDAGGLRDIANGRKRMPADLLARFSPFGLDVQYILTGVHGAPALTAEEACAGYVVEVLSPPEAQALAVLRASGVMSAPVSAPSIKQTISAPAGQIAAGNLVTQKQGTVNVGDRSKNKRKR